MQSAALRVVRFLIFFFLIANVIQGKRVNFTTDKNFKGKAYTVFNEGLKGNFTSAECKEVRRLVESHMSKIGNSPAVANGLVYAACTLTWCIPVIPTALLIPAHIISARVDTTEKRKLESMNIIPKTFDEVKAVCRTRGVPLTEKDIHVFDHKNWVRSPSVVAVVMFSVINMFVTICWCWICFSACKSRCR